MFQHRGGLNANCQQELQEKVIVFWITTNCSIGSMFSNNAQGCGSFLCISLRILFPAVGMVGSEEGRGDS